MRKQAVLLGLAGVLTAGAVALAAGAGGTATDPLISKSYADGAFITQAVAKAEEKITQRHDVLYKNAEAALKTKADQYAAQAGVSSGTGTYSPALTDQRLKQGDVVQVGSGSGFLLLAGTANLSCAQGKTVDLSNGWEQGSGALNGGHRYLAVENTTASVTITSPTAVLSVEGYYTLTRSASTDYNALADAMKGMGLFKGSDTAYGSGYDLEQPPTRIQGLIMFLRLLGEEQAALTTTAPCPFTDVPAWCKSYVAYAYEKGYTKGVDSAAKRFGTNDPLKAADYVTFLLRALGYTDSGAGADFTWTAALQRAAELGVLTSGERQALENAAFLRAHVVYVSYFALDASYKGTGETLQSRLVTGGALAASVADIRNAVTVQRIP